MKIAYVTLSGRGLIDDCIARIVERVSERGWRVAGTVRAAPVAAGDHPCDMDVQVLPDGPVFRISQALGTGSKGCRLDGGAIEDIALAVEERLENADLLVLNKFGKQEAQGRGLRRAIERAIEIDLPVIVGVNGLNLPDFMAFTDGLAVQLQPAPDAAATWLLEPAEARRGTSIEPAAALM